MAATQGPHQVAQNSRMTTLPLSVPQSGRASGGACNSLRDEMSGGLLPTFGPTSLSAQAGQTRHAKPSRTAPRLFCSSPIQKEDARGHEILRRRHQYFGTRVLILSNFGAFQ